VNAGDKQMPFVAVKSVRDEYDRILTGRGHAMDWHLGTNARRRGYACFWEGRCEHCGAEMSVASGWTSCPGVRDARHQPCSGPGTAVLTEIETGRVSQLIAAAVDEFVRDATE
jgi:hypothetical protein